MSEPCGNATQRQYLSHECSLNTMQSQHFSRHGGSGNTLQRQCLTEAVEAIDRADRPADRRQHVSVRWILSVHQLNKPAELKTAPQTKQYRIRKGFETGGICNFRRRLLFRLGKLFRL